MAVRIKKGEMVEIITGEHKGATGRVIRVNRKGKTVTVQGHNVANKHVRPSRKNPQGGRISIEQPIAISNVQPVNPKSSKGSRVRYELTKNGGKTKVSIDGSEISVVRRSKKQS